MPSGIKMLKVLGGIVEIGFILSFVYEFGKEVGRKEQQETDAIQQADTSLNSLNTKELIDILKNVDKNAVNKARSVTIK